MFISNCCKEEVKIAGDTTMYFVCTKCKKACDTAKYAQNDNGRKGAGKDGKYKIRANS